MTISAYAENAILDKIFRNVNFTTTTIYMSLHSAWPSESGGAGELSGGGYARQNATAAFTTGAATVSGAGEIKNKVQIEFNPLPAVAAPGVVAFAFWDAVTGGNCLWVGWLGGTPVQAFTALASTNLITSYGHGLAINDPVVFEPTADPNLPTGLTEGAIYYVIAGSFAADTFTVSTTVGGAAVDITGNGEGLVIKLAPKVVATAGDALRFAIDAITIRID